jgi:hypothetical protein
MHQIDIMVLIAIKKPVFQLCVTLKAGIVKEFYATCVVHAHIYMGIIGVLCLCFVYPSKDRCQMETSEK